MTTTDARRLRERPFGELLSEFANETTDLIGKEFELARAEVGEQVNRAKSAAGLFGAAAVVGLAALGALTACAIIALALVIDAWLAALIVGGAMLLVACILALAGRSRMKSVAPPVPEQTLGNLKRDFAAVQHGVQAGREHDGNGGGAHHGP